MVGRCCGRASCNAVVETSVDVACAADILGWLPLSVREAALKSKSAMDRDLIFDPPVVLSLGDANLNSFSFGTVHIAGPPCVDFSPMGAQKREGGPSMPCFLTWAWALRFSVLL